MRFSVVKAAALSISLVLVFLAYTALSSIFSPSFAVYVEGDSTSGHALTNLLGGWKHNAVQVSSLEEALRSRAEVLVLWLADQSSQSVDDATLNALKKRRVIAVGYGSAELFEKLGLEINDQACAHDPDNRSPRIRLERSSMVNKEQAQHEVVAFTLPADTSRDHDHDFAMYIPAKSHLRSAVEVIGRWSGGQAGSSNYAPIVRQGDYLMVGFAAPVTAWTGEYRKLFTELATSLLRHNPQPFPAVKWPPTKPGVYKFRLARLASTNDLADKTFYFTFKSPTTFTARLDAKGSSDVMLLFVGKDREHWVRKDAGLDQQTQIKVPITEKNARSSGVGHWRLGVTNFDPQHEAECTLTIMY